LVKTLHNVFINGRPKYMGRRDLQEQEERDGIWIPGEREWDWNENLEIRTACCVKSQAMHW
jgi:hypothetical protein